MMMRKVAASITLVLTLVGPVALAQVPLVSALTQRDMGAMAGGMSCVAMAGSKTVFYDDGEAIIRVGGALVKLGKHDSVPARQYVGLGGALRVELAKRPGRRKMTEEGSLDPMVLKVMYRNATQTIPVMMNCSA
ncbi:hypothetical protein [Novosphingobium humi]|uniref:Uncharacterized protein n=1 Tax=Novosphingobium humi TaxID=2282397 RepID=A0ABY7U627_9SPHN|nr:hypothetical protein [Novosphingobium humi]WCT80246.1 hypothetical protein PQ457_22130 [Novosphingobium humi]